MGSADDVARFRAEDASVLVEASFACPWCLHRASTVLLMSGDHDTTARCRCFACDRAWLVLLNAEQLLRLALPPPTDLRLQRPLTWGG